MAISLSADSPSETPKTVKVFSHNRRYFVVSEPKTKRTQAYTSGRTSPLWELPGFHSVMFLSDNGEDLVIGQPDGNLLPKTAQLTAELFTFYSRGKQVRTVKVSELFTSLGVLPKTASHLAWGNYSGFEGEHRFVLLTFEGKKIVFDPSSGKKIGG